MHIGMPAAAAAAQPRLHRHANRHANRHAALPTATNHRAAPRHRLLNVTRAVASEASALAAGGGIAPSDVAAVLDGSAIKVLCQLAQWLQAPPQVRTATAAVPQASMQQMCCAHGHAD